MNPPTRTFDMGGARFLPDETMPAAFTFFPIRPSLAPNQAGSGVQASVTKSRLMVTTRLAVDPDLPDRLKKIENDSGGVFRFEQAPVSVHQATIELADASGTFHPIGEPSTSSGMPPFNAVFQADIADFDTGDGGLLLRARYEIEVNVVNETSASCSVTGVLTEDARALAEKSRLSVSIFDAKRKIEQGISEGRLTKILKVSANAAPALERKVEKEALDGAARFLQNIAQKISREKIDLKSTDRYELLAEGDNLYSVTDREVASFPAECVTDIDLSAATRSKHS